MKVENIHQRHNIQQRQRQLWPLGRSGLPRVTPKTWQQPYIRPDCTPISRHQFESDSADRAWLGLREPLEVLDLANLNQSGDKNGKFSYFGNRIASALEVMDLPSCTSEVKTSDTDKYESSERSGLTDAQKSARRRWAPSQRLSQPTNSYDADTGSPGKLFRHAQQNCASLSKQIYPQISLYEFKLACCIVSMGILAHLLAESRQKTH